MHDDSDKRKAHAEDAKVSRQLDNLDSHVQELMDHLKCLLDKSKPVFKAESSQSQKTVHLSC